MFDAMKAELSMLGFLPIADLPNFKQPSEKVEKERAACLQELLHFYITGGLTQLGKLVNLFSFSLLILILFSCAEVEHAFRQFVLECVELSETNEDGIVSQRPRECPQYNIPWDYPFPYFMGMIPTWEEDEVTIEVESSSSRKSRPRSGNYSPLLRG
jgi:hypothetical protein